MFWPSNQSAGAGADITDRVCKPGGLEADPLTTKGMDPWAAAKDQSQLIQSPMPSHSKRKPRSRKSKMFETPTRSEPSTPQPAAESRFADDDLTPEPLQNPSAAHLLRTL